MKVLIIGGGGREHALAWRLAQSDDVTGLIASPGNPGMAALATCIAPPGHVSGYAQIAERYGATLTVVGPEAPLVEGVVDVFRDRKMPILGPTQAAARLEGSKIFAKRFFAEAGIPTARSSQVTSYEEGRSQLQKFGWPVVIKADGLAAGKGVVIAQTGAEAEDAMKRLGPKLVIEEFLEGEEVSFIGLSNGRSLLPFAPTQDHKRAFDGDMGPNTGGMGAYCDGRILTSSQTEQILDRIMIPTIRQMSKEGTPFTGFLYAGIMMTSDGPQLLEFNVRLGDPEAQCLMHSFEGDLAALLASAVGGDSVLSGSDWGQPSVCVVMAAAGYPKRPSVGDEIRGIAEAEATGAVVFQAGTCQDGAVLKTAGGRVLGVTAGGETLEKAIRSAYAGVGKIGFSGAQYRTDIGQKGVRRW